ncbi:unnamed protein product [Oncorhynchus mykiss]|uniref:AIG1-type G domain-containing protein n=1 Tax=Oncorhynchus mykiss TaxID=8022 RepID=A0A060YVW2_ONCMY|nr:unnamed protein product [Oncorhynchus mykiss]
MPGAVTTTQSQGALQDWALECLSLSECSKGIHSFLLVAPLGRLTEQERRGAQCIRRMFGEKAHGFTQVLFTYELEQKDSLEDLLKEREAQRLVEECGGRFHVCPKSIGEELEVTGLLGKVDSILDQGTDRCYTVEMHQEAQPLLVEFREQLKGLLDGFIRLKEIINERERMQVNVENLEHRIFREKLARLQDELLLKQMEKERDSGMEVQALSFIYELDRLVDKLALKRVRAVEEDHKSREDVQRFREELGRMVDEMVTNQKHKHRQMCREKGEEEWELQNFREQLERLKNNMKKTEKRGNRKEKEGVCEGGRKEKGGKEGQERGMREREIPEGSTEGGFDMGQQFKGMMQKLGNIGNIRKKRRGAWRKGKCD